MSIYDGDDWAALVDDLDVQLDELAYQKTVASEVCQALEDILDSLPLTSKYGPLKTAILQAKHEATRFRRASELRESEKITKGGGVNAAEFS